jgi:endonuclease IV
MKLLMIYCHTFAYNPTVKTLESFPEVTEPGRFENVLTGIIHAEASDMEDEKGVLTKLLKNLKWAAKKNETQQIILHSFAHLSESKATPEFSKALFDKTQQRLENAGYEVAQTPFGYFLDLNVDAPGYSQARMFKSI